MMKFMLTHDALIVDGTKDEIAAFEAMRRFVDFIAEEEPYAPLVFPVSTWIGMTLEEWKNKRCLTL